MREFVGNRGGGRRKLRIIGKGETQASYVARDVGVDRANIWTADQTKDFLFRVA